MSEATKVQAAYGAEQIQVLEGLEPVRKRPGMYIGSTGPRGLHHLVYEVVDNSVDEALAGHCNEIRVAIEEDGSCSVSDNGRGIPTDVHPKTGKSALETVLTVLHAGGKFGAGGYKVSGGLHGVGVSCVNALSDWLKVTVHKHGKIHTMEFARGIKSKELEVVGETDHTGTTVQWKPDGSIFTTVDHQYEIVQKRLRETAYLMGSRGLRLELVNEAKGTHEVFEYPEGIQAFVQNVNQGKTPLHEEILFLAGSAESPDNPGEVYEVELAMQWTDG